MINLNHIIYAEIEIIKESDKMSKNELNESCLKTSINWFPGHMAKAKRELKENLKLVDLVAEIVDARIPISSTNPDFFSLYESKLKILVLNKTDLVDSEHIKKWIDYYKSNNIECVSFSTKSSKSAAIFIRKVKDIMEPKLKVWKSKGMIGRKIRIMVTGIPNTGKSAFINKLAGNSKAKVENRPGVTRNTQWVNIGKSIELLDTPGVLPPKLSNNNIAYNLAFTGAIKDSILDLESLAVEFLKKLKKEYPVNLSKRYNLNLSYIENKEVYELLNLIGKNRKMLLSGGEINILRTSEMILEEFRSGKLGQIILELPQRQN